MLHRMIRKYVVPVLFMVLPGFTCLACNSAFRHGVGRSNPFYKYASEYVRADEMMILNAREGKETAVEDLRLRDGASDNLLKSPSPTIPQLETLLTSADPLDRKVALVNIMLRRIYSPDLFDKLAAINDPKDNYFIRFYSSQCFNFLDQETTRKYEDKLADILRWECCGSNIIAAMPSISKFERWKLIPLFVAFLKQGDRGVRSVCYVYLVRLGDDYLAEVERWLKQEGAVDALEFIEAAKSGRKP